MRTLLALWFALVPVIATAGGSPDLKIGVRIDAAPFAFAVPGEGAKAPAHPGEPQDLLPGEKLSDRYGGYVVNVCSDVIEDLRAARLGLSFGVVEVTASDRIEALRSGSIDVLCDPASMTRDRNRIFLAFGPIYLSGISFATHEPEEPGRRKHLQCMYPVGVVDQTTADSSGALAIAKTGEWSGGEFDPRQPSVATRVQGYLLGGRNDEAYGTFETCAALETIDAWLKRDTAEPPGDGEVRQAGRVLQGLLVSEMARSALESQVGVVLAERVENATDDTNGSTSEANGGTSETEDRASKRKVSPSEVQLETLLEKVRNRAANVRPVKAYASHALAARDFCDFRVRYYVGDIEIINYALASAGCPYADASLTYTAERYAIYLRMPKPSGDSIYATNAMRFLRALAAHVYDQNSVLIDAYEATFPKVTPTRQLQALIWSLSGDFPQ